MLTKLTAAMADRGAVAIVDVGADELMAVCRRLGFDVEELRSVDGGTSAVAKLARGGSRSAFLKSYRWHGGEEHLGSEAGLLAAACRGLVEVRLMEAGDGLILPWLAMDELQPPNGLIKPGCVHRLVADYSTKLLGISASDGLQLPSFSWLLKVASEAVSALVDAQELEGRMVGILRAALDMVATTIERAEPVICHGDLSPRNILQTANGRLVAVDWEDAVLGFAGYDYLYWLTFLDNRRFYGPDALGATGLGVDFEKSVMLTVVLLKGYIAFKNKTIKQNRVPLMARLDEINSI